MWLLTVQHTYCRVYPHWCVREACQRCNTVRSCIVEEQWGMWMSWCVNALFWWILDPQLLAQCQHWGREIRVGMRGPGQMKAQGLWGPLWSFSTIHLVYASSSSYDRAKQLLSDKEHCEWPRKHEYCSDFTVGLWDSCDIVAAIKLFFRLFSGIFVL